MVASHENFIRNRLGYVGNNLSTPHFLRYGKESDSLKHCHVLYSPCWPVTDSYYSKFDVGSGECKWMGISEHQKPRAEIDSPVQK